MRSSALLLPVALALTAAGPPAKKAAASKTTAPKSAKADPDPTKATEHVVKPGETLMGIARRAEVPRILIIEANRLKPPHVVRTGQRLRIPRTRHHTVLKGDSGFGLAWRYGVPWKDIAVANGIDPGKPLRSGQKLLIPTILDAPEPAEAPASPSEAEPTRAARFAWPVAGPIRRGFLPRAADKHDGLDITAAEGTAVRAAAAGTVIHAAREPSQFGNLVVIDHGNGWHSAYAFLQRFTVKRGEAVNAGERIGMVGRTGLAKGPELHFEVRRNNRPVDPRRHLPERK